MKPHPTHFCVEEACEIAERIQAKKTFLTHICHDLEHEATNASLPQGIELAYDGLRLEIEL
ncbi:MAG: hypothetical protein GY880_15065 [Planctomycetaceae bacterium]|nr:hypothetical protein [Planctomycetaceae bacterium]